jgi:carotenoid cleavage dioxygenase
VALRSGYSGVSASGRRAAAAFRISALQTGASQAHVPAGGRGCGVRVFVPAAGARAEDDGYLLSFVFDPATQRSELLILEAANMASPPIARVHLPTRVPAGFHGSWVADPA